MGLACIWHWQMYAMSFKSEQIATCFPMRSGVCIFTCMLVCTEPKMSPAANPILLINTVQFGRTDNTRTGTYERRWAITEMSGKWSGLSALSLCVQTHKGGGGCSTVTARTGGTWIWDGALEWTITAVVNMHHWNGDRGSIDWHFFYIEVLKKPVRELKLSEDWSQRQRFIEPLIHSFWPDSWDSVLITGAEYVVW